MLRSDVEWPNATSNMSSLIKLVKGDRQAPNRGREGELLCRFRQIHSPVIVPCQDRNHDLHDKEKLVGLCMQANASFVMCILFTRQCHIVQHSKSTKPHWGCVFVEFVNLLWYAKQRGNVNAIANDIACQALGAMQALLKKQANFGMRYELCAIMQCKQYNGNPNQG